MKLNVVFRFFFIISEKIERQLHSQSDDVSYDMLNEGIAIVDEKLSIEKKVLRRHMR